MLAIYWFVLLVCKEIYLEAVMPPTNDLDIVYGYLFCDCDMDIVYGYLFCDSHPYSPDCV